MCPVVVPAKKSAVLALILLLSLFWRASLYTQFRIWGYIGRGLFLRLEGGKSRKSSILETSPGATWKERSLGNNFFVLLQVLGLAEVAL